MHEPTGEISPFEVGHTAGFVDRSGTLGYLKRQSPMRASPVVVVHIDPKDAIEMPGPEDEQPGFTRRCGGGLGRGRRMPRLTRKPERYGFDFPFDAPPLGPEQSAPRGPGGDSEGAA